MGRRGWVAVCYSHHQVLLWFHGDNRVQDWARRFIGWQPHPPAESRARDTLRRHLLGSHADELDEG